MPKQVSVLFVCIGNICRSPTAEGIFQSMVEKSGLSDKIKVDSAGSHGYHVGELPHATTRSAAAKRGYNLQSRARQYTEKDFSDFDYILGMDVSNKEHLCALAPENSKAEIISFIDLCPTYKDQFPDVPDPYYGGPKGFDLVLDVVEEGCKNLLAKIKKDHLKR
jgi:protein-tyrosine phosphatase